MSKILIAIRQAFTKGIKTRYEVSKDTGVNQATLSKVMKGGGMNVDTAELVAKALNIEITVKQKEEKKA